jgi:hypothetical protein
VLLSYEFFQNCHFDSLASSQYGKSTRKLKQNKSEAHQERVLVVGKIEVVFYEDESDL